MQSGSMKPQVPHHALALYQQQITKAHESARDDMAQSKQLQQTEQEQQPSSSPRDKSRSPAVGDKEGKMRPGVISQSRDSGPIAGGS